MQITSVKKEELALIISGLRSIWVPNEEKRKLLERLLKQMEDELSQRFGLVCKE